MLSQENFRFNKVAPEALFELVGLCRGAQHIKLVESCDGITRQMVQIFICKVLCNLPMADMVSTAALLFPLQLVAMILTVCLIL